MVRLFFFPHSRTTFLSHTLSLHHKMHIWTTWHVANKPLFSHCPLFICSLRSWAVALCGNERFLEHLQHYQWGAAITPSQALLRLSCFWCSPASGLGLPPVNALLLPGCPNAACTALGFLKSQKCFTKALYPSAPLDRRGQLRHRGVQWFAQAHREPKTESRTLLSYSPALFLNQGLLSVLQPTTGKQKRDLSDF